MTDWLKRVDIIFPLNNILADISKSYKLGVIQSHSFFEQGYEDLNIRLVTDKSIFVVKIFSKYRPVDFINTYANALTIFHNAGIPVPVLRAYNNHHIYAVPGTKQTSYLCVMDFFDGKQFLELTPQKRDIETITKYLARLHRFSFPIQSDYDSWGICKCGQRICKKQTVYQAGRLGVSYRYSESVYGN